MAQLSLILFDFVCFKYKNAFTVVAICEPSSTKLYKLINILTYDFVYKALVDANTVGDIAFEGISELISIAGDIFKERLEVKS